MTLKRIGISLVVAAVVLALLVALVDDQTCTTVNHVTSTDAAGNPIYFVQGPGGQFVEIEKPPPCPFFNRLGLVVGFVGTDRCQAYQVSRISLGVNGKPITFYEKSGRSKTLTCQAMYPFWAMVVLGAAIFSTEKRPRSV